MAKIEVKLKNVHILYKSLTFFPPLSYPCLSILAEAKNLSFNATAAVHAYSNIKANIDAAEKEAKAAKQNANMALELVRIQKLLNIF